jgi:hypothetical protein
LVDWVIGDWVIATEVWRGGRWGLQRLTVGAKGGKIATVPAVSWSFDPEQLQEHAAQLHLFLGQQAGNSSAHPG